VLHSTQQAGAAALNGDGTPKAGRMTWHTRSRPQSPDAAQTGLGASTGADVASLSA